MSASVEVTTETKKDVLAIPIQAVTTREKEQDEEEEKSLSEADDDLLVVVFVADGKKASQKEVTTGIQDDTYIEVLTGLTDGQKIISGPFAAVSKKLEEGEEIYEAEKKKKKRKKKKSTEKSGVKVEVSE